MQPRNIQDRPCRVSGIVGYLKTPAQQVQQKRKLDDVNEPPAQWYLNAIRVTQPASPCDAPLLLVRQSVSQFERPPHPAIASEAMYHSRLPAYLTERGNAAP